MGRHHRDRDYDRDMIDDLRMNEPYIRDPRIDDHRERNHRRRDPRMVDPRMMDPRMIDPRMMNPNARTNPGINNNPANSGNMNNIAGSIGSLVRNFANNINLAELLKGVDINQIISLLTALAGGRNSNANPLLSLLGFGSPKGDPMPPAPKMTSASPSETIPQNPINADAMKNQLSMLADRLMQMGGNNSNSLQGQLLSAIKALQQSPELMNMFNSFVNANMPNINNISNTPNMNNTSNIPITPDDKK